jgi:hypothetical protein
VKMAAWIKPKMQHKHMVQKLLQVRAHLILCFRAEPKVEMVKNREGKLEIQAKQSLVGKDGWIPICEKNLPFETTAYFLLLASEPGIPKPIKLQEQHRAIFPLDHQITEESGRLVAAWAAGGGAKPAPEHPTGASASPLPAAGEASEPIATGERDALLIKAREWAECGVPRYEGFWTGLTPEQRKAIGAAEHEKLKAIAAKVPT